MRAGAKTLKHINLGRYAGTLCLGVQMKSHFGIKFPPAFLYPPNKFFCRRGDRCSLFPLCPCLIRIRIWIHENASRRTTQGAGLRVVNVPAVDVGLVPLLRLGVAEPVEPEEGVRMRGEVPHVGGGVHCATQRRGGEQRAFLATRLWPHNSIKGLVIPGKKIGSSLRPSRGKMGT